MSIEGATTITSGSVSLVVSSASGKIIRMFSGDGSNLLLEPSPDAGAEVQSSGPTVDDVFDVRRAWGFDECYPTVGKCVDFSMRDHGWIWGNATRLSNGKDSLLCEWILPSGGVFRREIFPERVSAEESGSFRFEVDFPAVLNFKNQQNLPSVCCAGLYAAHALFAVDTGDSLEIWDCLSGETPALVWSDVFPHPSSRVAQKFFVTGGGALQARLVRRSLNVEIRVECIEELKHLGIWWCNNGWGDGREHRTIGIEPTSHPSDGPVFVSDASNQLFVGRNCVSFRVRVLPLCSAD